jgi:probable rRNA maturation factor
MSSGGSTFLFQRCPAGIDRTRLRRFHKRLESELAGGGQFNCLLTGDARLRELNREFLRKDIPTDVLSFPSGSRPFLGEIAISSDRAASQAAEFGHSIEQEIEILMLHGALHLIGMDHEKDRGRMKKAERRWRLKFGLSGSLIERASA